MEFEQLVANLSSGFDHVNAFEDGNDISFDIVTRHHASKLFDLLLP